MRLFLRRSPPERVDPELPDVSQPMPLPAPPRRRRAPEADIVVVELTELEARALCAREDIAVFWPRPPQK
jgi:hypothetical protein